LGGLSVDGRIILKWILRVSARPVAGCYECGNKLLTSVKGGKFLDQLNDYQLLK
jgi:hypothetical protein